MLAIRLSRVGKRNSAFFRVVVMDKQKSAKGRALEVLGSVNPHKKDIVLKNERILYWIGVGAQPSDRVHNILVSKGVIKGPKLVKKIRKARKTEEATEEGSMKQEAGEEKKEVVVVEKPEEKVEELKEEKIEETKGEVKEEKPEEVKPEETKEEPVANKSEAAKVKEDKPAPEKKPETKKKAE